MAVRPQTDEKCLPPSTKPRETQGIRGFVNVDADKELKNTIHELELMGLSLRLRSDRTIGVSPMGLVDDRARELITRNRDGLIAILAERDPDPIRRGFLTGQLAGWRIDPNGERVDELAPWHREWLDL